MVYFESIKSMSERGIDISSLDEKDSPADLNISLNELSAKDLVKMMDESNKL